MRFDNLIIMTLFITVIMISGMIGGIVYFQFNLLESELLKINFDIPFAQNSSPGIANVTTFQDVLNLTIYPWFILIDWLPILVYIMIFGFIIGLAITAYMTSKNPIFFVLHLLFTIVLTYFALVMSNAYKEIMSDAFFNAMMISFPVYNKVMFYLPQIFFMTSIVFAGIAFVNVIKPSTKESPYGINYGGDY